MIEKEPNRQSILKQLRADYEIAIKSANAAHNDATNSESKAENRYDTLGLEASYLAEGQSRRVALLEEEIALYEKLIFAAFSDESTIRLTALVRLEGSSENSRCLFIGPHSGGLRISLPNDNDDCLVVTPQSPLGKALMGKQTGDELSINITGQATYYEITHVC